MSLASVPALTSYNARGVPLTQRSLAAASIGATYSIVGSIFATGVILLIVVSTLDEDIQLSLDGSTDFIPLLAGGTLIIDEKTNGIVLPGYLGVYAKQLGVPASGSVYVGGFTV